MPLAKGKRVALAAVAVGLLLVVGGLFASRAAIIQRWRIWKTEQATLKRLSSVKFTMHLGVPCPLSKALEVLSRFTGINSVVTPQVAALAMEENGGFSVKPFVHREESGETVLRSILARTDPNLEYTIKGDTIVIGLKPGTTPSPPAPPDSEPSNP